MKPRPAPPTRECPICKQPIKLANMERHFRNVHPASDISMVLSKEERKAIQGGQRSPARFRPPFYSRKSFVAMSMAIAVALVLVFLAFPYLTQGPPGSTFNVVTYCGSEGVVEHYHPLLVINTAAGQQHLPYDPSQPADIGYIAQPGYTNASYYCPGRFHALHTHDGSGIIHVELPQVPSKPSTLRDFFEIWGEPLAPSQVWTFAGRVTATMHDSDTHASSDYSSNPGAIPLYVPAAGATGNGYSIPQDLIFQGAYGDGRSGGYFSGEIIWLNLTS